ncbi:MAG: VWA domain-containing protein [Nakamurella sp.]
MVDPTYDAVGPERVAELTDFTFALRLAGVAVTIEGSMSFLREVAELESHDHVQLYWAGRRTLCDGAGDGDIYDETFNWFFRREVPVRAPRPAGRRSVFRLVTADDVAPGDAHTRDAHTRDAHPRDHHTRDQHFEGDHVLFPDGPRPEPEMIPHDDLAELSEDELVELTALIRLLEPVTPGRRGTRADAIRSLRSVFRTDSTDGPGLRLGTRPRSVVVLVDVSDTMAPHAAPVLAFAHAARRALGAGCEVHSIGRPEISLSEALDDPDPTDAAAAVEALLPGWTGNDTLGQALNRFLDEHGHRRLVRGAVVIVVSDGCDRGSSQLLIEQARRLGRVSRLFLWINPHPAVDGRAPATRGLLAVRPFCDHLLAGDALTALGELMDSSRDA